MNRRMPATETVRMALSTLRSNRLRSLLTMVGIVIGNASVITLVGVGRGAQLLAEGQLNNLGANVLFRFFLLFYSCERNIFALL
jgi:putative ABC transport system permease protein